jgi:hypothetical protein
VANAFISPFNTQTMHVKSFYTEQNCCFPKTLYPGGIRTRVFVPEGDAMSTTLRPQGTLGSFFLITEVDRIFWKTFFHGKNHVFILTKMGMAIHIMADFFTNASGHTDRQTSILIWLLVSAKFSQ